MFFALVNLEVWSLFWSSRWLAIFPWSNLVVLMEVHWFLSNILNWIDIPQLVCFSITSFCIIACSTSPLYISSWVHEEFISLLLSFKLALFWIVESSHVFHLLSTFFCFVNWLCLHLGIQALAGLHFTWIWISTECTTVALNWTTNIFNDPLGF